MNSFIKARDALKKKNEEKTKLVMTDLNKFLKDGFLEDGDVCYTKGFSASGRFLVVANFCDEIKTPYTFEEFVKELCRKYSL